MGLVNNTFPPLIWVVQLIIAADSILGIFTNLFIIFVNLQGWIKGQSLNSCDHIVIALAFSNTFFSGLNAVNFIFYMFFIQLLYVDYVYNTMYILLTYPVISSSWLSACLCLFYCMKINRYKQRLLVWIQMKIDVIVPWMIALSQILSVLSCLTSIWSFTEVNPQNSTAQMMTNQTSVFTGTKLPPLYNIISLFIVCVIPFLMVMITTGHIIASLWTHTRHMKLNVGEFGVPSLKPHKRAAYTVTSILILYLIFYVVELGLQYFNKVGPVYWICFVIFSSFSAVQSIILIQGNTKLNKAWEKIFSNCRVKHLQDESKHTDTK